MKYRALLLVFFVISFDEQCVLIVPYTEVVLYRQHMVTFHMVIQVRVEVVVDERYAASTIFTCKREPFDINATADEGQ